MEMNRIEMQENRQSENHTNEGIENFLKDLFGEPPSDPLRVARDAGRIASDISRSAANGSADFGNSEQRKEIEQTLTRLLNLPYDPKDRYAETNNPSIFELVDRINFRLKDEGLELTYKYSNEAMVGFSCENRDGREPLVLIHKKIPFKPTLELTLLDKNKGQKLDSIKVEGRVQERIKQQPSYYCKVVPVDKSYKPTEPKQISKDPNNIFDLIREPRWYYYPVK